jgi:hypothetical protein
MVRKKSKSPSDRGRQLSLELAPPMAPALPAVVHSGEIIPPEPIAHAQAAARAPAPDAGICARVPEMHQRHTDQGDRAFGWAFALALVVLVVKGGIQLTEANFMVFKFDISSRATVGALVGFLGLGIIIAVFAGCIHYLEARRLRREFPVQLVIRFSRGYLETVIINCMKAVQLFFVFSALLFGVFFSIAETYLVIVYIYFQLFPWPFETEFTSTLGRVR